MYNQTDWKDHVITPNNTYTKKDNSDGTITLTPAGNISQQGTNMSASNFNNQETGIQDSHTAFSVFLQYFMQFDRWVRQQIALLFSQTTAEFLNEIQTVTLTNSLSFPFNNSVKTISMTTARKTLNYDVSWEIVSSTGNVGDITITDKQLNGFKISFDGGATNVVLKIRIKGGMLV